MFQIDLSNGVQRIVLLDWISSFSFPKMADVTFAAHLESVSLSSEWGDESEDSPASCDPANIMFPNFWLVLKVQCLCYYQNAQCYQPIIHFLLTIFASRYFGTVCVSTLIS